MRIRLIGVLGGGWLPSFLKAIEGATFLGFLGESSNEISLEPDDDGCELDKDE